jgi:membrane fusion protein (multidrug efflux system)
MNSPALAAAVTAQTPQVNLSARPLVQPATTASPKRFEAVDFTEAPPPQARRKPNARHVGVVTLAVLAAAGLATFTHHWWTVGRFIQSTDDAYVGGDVTVIAAKVPGFIAALAVTDNQAVHAGDLLLKLDDRDYRASLAKAQAAMGIQRAALINLNAQRHLQEAVIAQAQAEINATDAETARTHTDQVRYEKLLQTGAVSIQNFQQADADHKRALAAGKKAQAALEAAQRQLEVIASQHEQVIATLAAAAADRDLAQLNLGYTELRAPMDGTIGNRSAQIGAYASSSAQLISLVPVRGLWIDANFKESQLAKIHPGSPATIKVDSISGKTFHGHVVSVAPATGAQFSVLPPENATGNFTKIVQRVAVRIVFDDEADTCEQLRPGLSVTAKIDTRSTGKAVL